MHLYPEAILCQWIERGTLRDMDFFWQLHKLTDRCAETELLRKDGIIETTFPNAPERLLRCCRNSVMVP